MGGWVGRPGLANAPHSPPGGGVTKQWPGLRSDFPVMRWSCALQIMDDEKLTASLTTKFKPAAGTNDPVTNQNGTALHIEKIVKSGGVCHAHPDRIADCASAPPPPSLPRSGLCHRVCGRGGGEGGPFAKRKGPPSRVCHVTPRLPPEAPTNRLRSEAGALPGPHVAF